MTIKDILVDGVIIAFDILGTEIARSATYDNVSIGHTPGLDPTETPDTSTFRAVFDEIHKSRQGLLPDKFTSESKEVIIIQSELSVTPVLEQIIIDSASRNWVIRKIIEDPAQATWILLVTRR